MRKELVYVPSNVILSDKPSLSISSVTKEMGSPGVFLVVKESDSKVGIFCEGSVWYVDSKHCFKVKEN
jgi:hypothetical protein